MKVLARPQLLVGSALLSLQQGRIDDAEQFIQDARAFSRERVVRYFYPLIEWADEMVCLAQGRPAEAGEAFVTGEREAVEIGMLPFALWSQIGVANALPAEGRIAEADQARARARTTVEKIAAGFTCEDLRAAFLTTSLKSLEG